MSQFFISSPNSGAIDVNTITTDSGVATPNAAGNINLVGTAAQGISSSAAGDTITLTISDASTTQKGVIELATDAESIAGTSSSLGIVPSSLKAKLGTQTSAALPFGQGDTLAFGWTNALTDGQLVVGSTAGTPQAASLTSTGGTITVSGGSNTLNIETAGSVSNSFTTDSGTATPSSGILNVAGGTNLNTAGATNVVTINLDTSLTGLTLVDSTSLTTSNAATGITLNTQTISTDGTDSNIDLLLSPKGTGTVVINTDLDVDNINIDGNTISSTNTNGNITLDPDGTGDVLVATGADFTVDNGNISTTTGNVFALSGTIQGTNTVGATLGTTNTATNIAITGVTFTAGGSDSNINITMIPKGTGDFIVSAGDILGSSGNLDVSGTVRGSTLYADGDAGGVASTNAVSNISSTTISSGTGTVKMSSVNNADNAVWIKVYAGTTAYWIPGWATNEP